MTITDMQMPFGGTIYRHVRSYNNLDLTYQDGPNGYGWKSSELPCFEQRANYYRAQFSEHDSVHFSLTPDSQGIYHATNDFPDTLQIDSIAKKYTVTRSNGKVWTFSSDSSIGVPAGMLKSVVNVSGDVTEFVYNSDSIIWKVQSYKQNAPAVLLAQMEYEYYPSGRIYRITLKESNGNNLQDVKRVIYEYYSATEANGSYDDLKTVTNQLFANNVWGANGTYYYRYYKGGQSCGNAHLLKMALFPAECESFAKAYGFPACLSAEDSNALAFATKYYEYDSQNRVILERVDRNRRTMQFQYIVYPENNDYNAVSNKTVTTNAQGEVSTIFTNFKGEVILRENTPPNGCLDSSVIYYGSVTTNG